MVLCLQFSQDASSLPSSQSFILSHLTSWGRQFPFPHRHSFGSQAVNIKFERKLYKRLKYLASFFLQVLERTWSITIYAHSPGISDHYASAAGKGQLLVSRYTEYFKSLVQNFLCFWSHNFYNFEVLLMICWKPKFCLENRDVAVPVTRQCRSASWKMEFLRFKTLTEKKNFADSSCLWLNIQYFTI